MSDDVESMRPHFERLLAFKDADGQGMTQQGMADQLNEQGVLSLTGQPWSKYSVRRILKKLALRTEASITQAKNLPDTAASPDREPTLRDDSPLMQWSYYESIRNVLEELTKSPYTEKDLAKALNEKKVATLDGKPWDKASVSRALRTLNPVTGSFEAEDEEIRKRIRKGLYDTASERFVSMAVKGRKKKGTPAKKEKAKEKKKKKKGKKKKG